MQSYNANAHTIFMLNIFIAIVAARVTSPAITKTFPENL